MSSQIASDQTEIKSDSSRQPEDLYGTGLGFLAFLIWGLFPLYFYYLRDVPPLVTLAFRAVFTSALLIPIVLIRGKFHSIVETLRHPWLDLGLFVTMATTAASWGFFIWLVAVNHTLYASLGNYGSPLVTVAFGALVFRERPRALQLVAIALAIIAVVVFARGIGRLPWESVTIAFVFAIYSVLRKKMDVDSTTALSVETLFATPLGIGYIAYAWSSSVGAEWTTSPRLLALLVGAGMMTAIPLLLFGSAARRCKLSTLGILNYLTPTGQFLCGVYFLNEATTIYQWISFVLIWAALVFFTIDLVLSEKRAQRRLSDDRRSS